MNKKVIVGLSGGVDSSVAALLLKEQGYEVIGLFMRNWDSLVNNDIRGHLKEAGEVCAQEKDFNDAEAVAKKIGIEIHRVDFVEDYWNEVFTRFIDEYKKSNTPNPDILCNKYIKFDKFLNYALEHFDADYIATGHYADILIENGTAKLLKCKDGWKDQTYFLAGLESKQLVNVLFPLANIKKENVRKIAEKNGLITANKKDSTGICFIGKRKIKDFLQNYIPVKLGDIKDKKTGKILGRHDGTMFYTIGQRFGLNVGGLKEPIFVCGKDKEKNILYTAPLSNQEDYLSSNSCIIKDMHWISGIPSEGKLEVKFKHGLLTEKVVVESLEDKERVRLIYEIKRAVTPGQACVIYKGDECLGHGIVEKAFKDENKLY